MTPAEEQNRVSYICPHLYHVSLMMRKFAVCKWQGATVKTDIKAISLIKNGL